MSLDTSLVSRITADFRLSWRELVIADVLYKVAAFVLFTPLVALLLRLFVKLSGSSVVADEDILLFLARPLGWVALVVVGAASLGLIALEQATLMAVGFAAAEGNRMDARESLVAALDHLWRILALTGRMVGWALLVAAPFLVAICGIYFLLLTDYDINYYLAHQPPVFWVAVGIASALALVFLALLVRRVVGWAFALQILLFEGKTPATALAESMARTREHRPVLRFWIVAWLVATMLFSMVTNGLVGLVGGWLVPGLANHLVLLSLAMGGLLLLWLVVGFVVSFLAAASFALLMVRLYRRRGDRGEARLDLDATGSHHTRANRVFRFSRRTLVWCVLAAVAASAVAGAVLMHGVRLEDDAQITAHRGASAAAPENTLAAVRLAIEAETDWVEIDVQETLDGVVVVAHDSDFKKVAGVATKVWEATYEELARIDIGGWFGPEFSNERVPTLAQVLDACKGKVGVNIELKHYGHSQRLEERVVELVEERDMGSEVVVMSLVYESARRMKELRPEWTVGLLSSVALSDLTRLEVDFLAVSTRIATRGFVKSAQRAGKKVHVWTVNDVLGMSTKLDRGVDNLITDEPALAREVLAQRAGMSTGERLVAGFASLLGGVSQEPLTEEDA